MLEKEHEKPALKPTDAVGSAKPRLIRNKFASDKLGKIGFRNPPEIEKTL